MLDRRTTIVICVVTLCLMIAVAIAYSVPAISKLPSPVAYWAFEGNGTDQAGEHPLAIGMGAPNHTPFSDGKIGRGMSQRGNAPGYITPRTADLDFSKDFTISVWVYRDRSMYDNDAILDTGSIYLAKQDAPPWNSRFGAFLKTAGASAATDLVDNSDFGPPGLNSWYHVLLFRKGNTVGIRVNNQGSSTADVSALDLAGGAMMFVGIQQYGYPWQGVLDELGIWDRALTDEEMAALYNNGAGLRLN